MKKHFSRIKNIVFLNFRSGYGCMFILIIACSLDKKIYKLSGNYVNCKRLCKITRTAKGKYLLLLHIPLKVFFRLNSAWSFRKALFGSYTIFPNFFTLIDNKKILHTHHSRFAFFEFFCMQARHLTFLKNLIEHTVRFLKVSPKLLTPQTLDASL